MSLTCSASNLGMAARRRLLDGNRTICHSGRLHARPGDGRASIFSTGAGVGRVTTGFETNTRARAREAVANISNGETELVRA